MTSLWLLYSYPIFLLRDRYLPLVIDHGEESVKFRVDVVLPVRIQAWPSPKKNVSSTVYRE